MRGLCWLGMLLALTACIEGSDLQPYVAEVKARPATPPEPLPEMNEYVPEAYRPGAERSPFAEPRPESLASPASVSVACAQPEIRASRSALEQYSLDNLSLRGTLGDGRGLWALVLTQDGVAHRVGMGQRMGLYHGEVIGITDSDLLLKEYIPDEKGCWEPRKTRLTLSRTQ
ncbi:pilus assembly protein PilP [Zobellella iuensis]|uniref:Pilus assembly protein PilP n=1 Tax=Zobellella iuensis TaxID=2803811 RepID=A0ABS1QP43_9GAMM|nr:pilus assembly protein PilP [Zobellella iuensis]MBL1376624.1 pilus assembly protein PilP [Zobellella iuensis]